MSQRPLRFGAMEVQMRRVGAEETDPFLSKSEHVKDVQSRHTSIYAIIIFLSLLCLATSALSVYTLIRLNSGGSGLPGVTQVGKDVFFIGVNVHILDGSGDTAAP